MLIIMYNFCLGRKARKEARKVGTRVPNLKDHDVVQKFFIQEVRLHINHIYIHKTVIKKLKLFLHCFTKINHYYSRIKMRMYNI